MLVLDEVEHHALELLSVLGTDPQLKVALELDLQGFCDSG
jgi:hypothetical protein